MATLKGNRIIIRNEIDARKIASAVAQIQMQYVGFVVFEMTTLINQLIVDPIQNKMRAKGISSKVIDRTYLDKTVIQYGQVIVFVIRSDYTSEKGFPVAVMIEFGRRAFFVRPLLSSGREQFVRVRIPGKFTSTLPKALHWIKDGKNFFSKGHRIPRKPGSYIITDGVRSGQPKVQRELTRRTKKWVNGILKS